MSITLQKILPCRACGADVDAITIESANPTRHPPFQERLLSRTLLRMTCGACGAPHLHFDRFVWVDLPGYLCACVVGEEERSNWAALDLDAYASLSPPLSEEGPAMAREWGKRVAIRLVFGLEELREKVLCRIYGLDDRIVEAVKITASPIDPRTGSAPTLDAVVPEGHLSFRLSEGDRLIEVPWSAYDRTASLRTELAVELPGLFAERSTWVHCKRAWTLPARV